MTEQHALLPSDHCTSTFAVEAPSEWIGRKIARGGAYIPTLPPARSKRQVYNFRWPHVCNIGRPLTTLCSSRFWFPWTGLESIPKLVETRVTSGRSGCGMSLAIGMDDPEFLLNRGTERREVAIAE